ncbi:hypothetical protein QBC32DRAFT_321188 [Pseudoneurospora amorphoporcata]|uniref:Reelin domain-containing protein n=1 Tax=Pseudoneurospora amorphoporcata TaxID=241081 RepID=A0AAN6P1R5_9PEZI|nr:hypothetical protein QBC32DRAFT_321188 [Pseudoneurospora amorphoporcata]
MHIQLLYLLLLCAASVTTHASPTPVVLDDGHDLNQVPAFNVTNFEASAMVLSNRNFYKFDVTFYHDATPVHCEALGTTINHQLTSIPQTFCPTGPSSGGSGSGYGNSTNNQSNRNSNSNQNNNNNNTTGRGVSFKWTEQPDGSGALLIVRRINDKVTDTAVYKVTPDCIPMMGDDIFRHQVYEGPENFSVPAYRSSESG